MTNLGFDLVLTWLGLGLGGFGNKFLGTELDNFFFFKCYIEDGVFGE